MSTNTSNGKMGRRQAGVNGMRGRGRDGVGERMGGYRAIAPSEGPPRPAPADPRSESGGSAPSGTATAPAPAAYYPVPDTLAHLAGTWRVARSVRDLAGGDEGRFTGRTVFSPLEEGGPAGGGGLPDESGPAAGGGLLHEESGTFTWRGTARPAERTLRFLPGRAPGTADVRFADGRPFHVLDLSTGHWIADHPCAADLYRGEFTVSGPDRWRSVWRVRGPAKDLVLTTDYTRDLVAPEPAPEHRERQ